MTLSMRPMQMALQAVAAGKAALSEKPIATTADAAQAYISRYRAMPKPVAPWLIGENFRFQSVVAHAANIVSTRLGKVHKIEHVCDVAYPKKTTCDAPPHHLLLIPASPTFQEAAHT